MLKTKRVEAGLSQMMLSVESGVPLSTIEYWERSREHIERAKVGNLKKVADVLGVKVDDLL